MRIAIPITDGKLCMHFGHCDQFAFIDVDKEQKKIIKREEIQSPPHQPGLLPSWLGQKGANLIIAGGMGQRAQDLFANQGIKVLVGASSKDPTDLVNDYLNDALKTGQNVCDH